MMRAAARFTTSGHLIVSFESIYKDAYVQADKKTTVLVWASVGAAAAGIAVAAILYKCRGSICSDQSDPEADHRHIEQVLQDCYSKIQEIEARLPSVLGAETTTTKQVRTGTSHRTRSKNGKPALGM